MNFNFVENELQQIFSTANTVNITSPIKFDYVIKAVEIKNLLNTKNLQKHLKKILKSFSNSQANKKIGYEFFGIFIEIN